MAVGPRANGVESRPVGREVVHDEEAAGLEQVEHEIAVLLGRVLEAAAVEEHELEWPARRQELQPVPDEELDVRVPGEPLRRDLRPLRVELDRDDAARRPRHRLGALAEGRPCLGDAPPGREDSEESLHLRNRRPAVGHEREATPRAGAA
jgi:hypothetical protein